LAPVGGAAASKFKQNQMKPGEKCPEFGTTQLHFPSAKRAISMRYRELSFPSRGLRPPYSSEVDSFQWFTGIQIKAVASHALRSLSHPDNPFSSRWRPFDPASAQ